MRNKYMTAVLLTTVFISCSDKYEDLNSDKKHPGVVPGSSLFTSGLKFIADQVNTSGVGENIFKLFSQYWTQTTYIQESNYDVINRGTAQAIFVNYYQQGLRDIRQAKIFIESEANLPAVTKNKLAIIELVNAYAFQQLVDIFGMVPYTEAFDIGQVYPKYDNGLDIYNDLAKRIDAALANLNPKAESFGNSDLFYKGDVNAWIKFAYTLKVKMGITLADVAGESARSRSLVESSYEKAFASTLDNCLMPYLEAAPNYNPLYREIVASGRHDYVIANTLVDIMNNLDDPRRSKYFTPVGVSSEYKGGPYGVGTDYSLFSHINDNILKPTFPGIMMTYTELQFYLAEAAARGYAVKKSAAAYYAEGIKSSILEWGGTLEEAAAYLAKTQVAYPTATDRSPDGWREKIATQSWIASYTRGLEAWTTWRRLDYPIFNPPKGLTQHDIPKRMTFPIDEQTINPKNYQAASAAIGEDKLSTKLFWDKY